METVPALIDRGQTARQDFGGNQLQRSAETAIAAVAAREEARTKALYVMAERHPRDWDTVRVRLMHHCERAGFAEIARYKKPAGKKLINGKWTETFAEGLSARFAEIARQEMGNTATETAVVFEDDMIRIVRASVTDLERNNLDSREVTIAKATEKKGKENRDGTWAPPAGREIISQRINSNGEPVWLVRATDDEIRAKQNSEISKSQRDESLRLIPKDIRDDCEMQVLATLGDPKKVDPAAARKKIIDGFAALNVMPDELAVYTGCKLEQCSPAQLNELRGLWNAIRDGEIDFQGALKAKLDQPGSAKEAQAVAEEKIARMEAERRAKKEEAKPKLETTSTGALPGADTGEGNPQSKTTDKPQPQPEAETKPAACTALQPAILDDSDDFDQNFLPWQKVNGVIYHLNKDGMSYHKHEPRKTTAFASRRQS